MRRRVAEGVRDYLSRHRSTCVFVAHEIDEALTMADEVLVLRGAPACIGLQERRIAGTSAWETDISDEIASAI